MKSIPFRPKQGETCDICNKVEMNRNTMITVCSCYKKHENQGRAHELCVINLIRDKDPEIGVNKCIYCNKEYQINIQKEFSFSIINFFSIKSFIQIYHFIMLFLMCFVFIVSLFSSKNNLPIRGHKSLSPITYALILALILYAMRSAYLNG